LTLPQEITIFTSPLTIQKRKEGFYDLTRKKGKRVTKKRKGTGNPFLFFIIIYPMIYITSLKNSFLRIASEILEGEIQDDFISIVIPLPAPEYIGVPVKSSKAFSVDKNGVVKMHYIDVQSQGFSVYVTMPSGVLKAFEEGLKVSLNENDGNIVLPEDFEKLIAGNVDRMHKYLSD